MSKNTAQFSPVFDMLARDARVGTIGALVFGVVWRHCQMRNKICYASKENMAALTGMNRKTIRTHLSRLVASGYIEDITPELRYKPHTYTITKYAESVLSDTESITENSGTFIPISDTFIPGGSTQSSTQRYSQSQEDTRQKGDKRRQARWRLFGLAPKAQLSIIRQFFNLRREWILRYFETTKMEIPFSNIERAVNNMFDNIVIHLIEGDENAALQELSMESVESLADDGAVAYIPEGFYEYLNWYSYIEKEV